MEHLETSFLIRITMKALRLTAVSLLLCGVVYVTLVYCAAQLWDRGRAQGSLIVDEYGVVVGSRLIGQNFASERYFHGRVSACGYDARASCGSNYGPSHPKLLQRVKEVTENYHADDKHLVPCDLVSASGSGLDPDISEAAAMYQVERVARARGMSEEELRQVIERVKRSLYGEFGGDYLVNVLELNLALDRVKP